MTKIISILLSIITAFSGLVMIDVEEIFSASSYIENIDDTDISLLDKNTGYIKNTVLVIFEEDASTFDKIGVLSKTDGVTVGSLREFNLYILRTDNKNYDELVSFCEELTSLEDVALASICPAKKLTEQYTPDDPFKDEFSYRNGDWDDQNPGGNNWHLEATDVRSAWGYSSQFENINIGVVDGGFDTEHEELAGKIVFPTAREKRRNRPNNHGTHVAGIIAAKADNGVGVSGICQNSTLTCVDWSPSTNQLWIADLAVLRALSRVVKAGAKVINFSVGNSSSMGDKNYEYPAFIPNLDAMLYSYAMGSLLNKGYDFVVVQSAGNGNGDGNAVDATQNGLFCPITKKNAFLPFRNVDIEDVLSRIIVVGSAELTKNGYVQSSSSNVGDRVDICAPGVEVYSTTNDNSYLSKSGTSMAAPVVTGVASLVWSLDSTLTGDEVKKIVCENTKDTVLPSDERFFDFLDYQAYPMVNAKLAVEATLRQKGNVSDVTFTADANEEIIFENESGEQFIFEADSSGQLQCVLKNGTYTVKTKNTVTEITVNGNCEISL